MTDSNDPYPLQDPQRAARPADPLPASGIPLHFQDDTIDLYADEAVPTPPMDDDQPIPIEHFAEPLAPSAPHSAAQWSPAQLQRLADEWRRLKRSFAYHPFVRITPLRGDPPCEYQIEYRVKTVVMTNVGDLEYAESASVHIWLPPRFPEEMPLVRPSANLFHPNITRDGINIERAWLGVEPTLAYLITYVGALAAFQFHDPARILNDTALAWIEQNPQVVPVDPNANFQPDAGGDPLARISRFGPRTIESCRTRLKQLCDSMLADEGAPANSHLESSSASIHQELAPFLEDDISSELRAAATEIADAACALPASSRTWETIRAYRRTAAHALSISHQMRDVEKSLTLEMRTIDELIIAEPAPAPVELIRQIPDAQRLSSHLDHLGRLINRGAELLSTARASATKVEGMRPLVFEQSTSLLARRIQAEADRASTAVTESLPKIKDAYSWLKPAIATAQVYVDALRRVAEWRSYADLFDHAEQILRNCHGWGALGIQACYFETATYTAGPIEFEDRLKFNTSRIAVLCLPDNTLEVIDAQDGRSLSRGRNGRVELRLPAEGNAQPLAGTFRLTATCRQLAAELRRIELQSESLLRHRELPQQLPNSWLAVFLRAISSEESLAALRHAHGNAKPRWRAIEEDLEALAPFKERLATLRSLQRTEKAAGLLIQRHLAAKKELAHATRRLTEIAAASGRDFETGQMLVPQRFAKEYAEQLADRDAANWEISQIDALLELTVENVRARLAAPDLLGSPHQPTFHLLPWPPQWDALLPHASDDAIHRLVATLESAAGLKLTA